MHAQQPAAHAGRNGVTRVASRRLLNLGDEELLMLRKHHAKGWTSVNSPSHDLDIKYRSLTRHLHHNLIRRHFIVECLNGSITPSRPTMLVSIMFPSAIVTTY